MVRKAMCALLALGLVLGLGSTARAMEEDGAIRITLENGQGVVTEGEVTLYCVGFPVSDGYRLRKEYGGGIIKAEDAMSSSLGVWLAEMAADGEARLLDADGSAEFSGLEEGLYLVKQSETAEGYCPMESFLITIPYDGQKQIQAYPKAERILTESPRTGQSPLPILGVIGMVLSGTGLIMCYEDRKRK